MQGCIKYIARSLIHVCYAHEFLLDIDIDEGEEEEEYAEIGQDAVVQYTLTLVVIVAGPCWPNHNNTDILFDNVDYQRIKRHWCTSTRTAAAYLIHKEEETS